MAYPHESKYKRPENWGETKKCGSPQYSGGITSDRPRTLCEAVDMEKTLDVYGITNLHDCLFAHGAARFGGGISFGDGGGGIGAVIHDGNITLLAGDGSGYGDDICGSLNDKVKEKGDKEENTLVSELGDNSATSSFSARAATSGSDDDRSPLTYNLLQVNCQSVFNAGTEFNSQTEFTGQSSFFGDTRFTGLAWHDGNTVINSQLKFSGSCINLVTISYVASIQFPGYRIGGTDDNPTIEETSSGSVEYAQITVMAAATPEPPPPPTQLCSPQYVKTWKEPINTYDRPAINNSSNSSSSDGGGTGSGGSGTSDPGSPVIQPSLP